MMQFSQGIHSVWPGYFCKGNKQDIMIKIDPWTCGKNSHNWLSRTQIMQDVWSDLRSTRFSLDCLYPTQSRQICLKASLKLNESGLGIRCEFCSKGKRSWVVCLFSFLLFFSTTHQTAFVLDDNNTRTNHMLLVKDKWKHHSSLKTQVCKTKL